MERNKETKFMIKFKIHNVSESKNCIIRGVTDIKLSYICAKLYIPKNITFYIFIAEKNKNI